MPPSRLRAARLVAALSGLTLLTAACTSPSPGSATSKAPLPAESSATPALADGHVDKLLVFVVENKSVEQEMTQMPYVKGLAETYGYAADYTAIQHPSLPNYLAIFGGQTYGVNDDEPPSAHTAAGPSVFGEALRAGRTAKLYAEAMPSNCATNPEGRYAVKHNPWAYFVDERADCTQFDVPFDAFAGDVASGSLPNLGMAIPDMCNDAHDCELSVTNTWLTARMQEILAGPDWRSGRLAIVITADEDDGRHGNQILTVVVHPSLHHVIATTPLTHFSLTRAYAEVAGVAPLASGAAADSMLTAFHLQATARG